MTELASPFTTSDFDYPLDESRIAQRPAARRDQARLLVTRRRGGELEDRRIDELPQLMAAGDVLVLNETRVFPARLLGRKPTGAAVEVLLLRPLDHEQRSWSALVRPGSKLKPGRVVRVSGELELRIEESTEDGGRIVNIETPLPVYEALSRYGHVPLPPYIRREDDDDDRVRYQTVYARKTGSVAAPTAGLHFTERLLSEIEARGVEIARVVLHVGPGTFRPVDVEAPERHRLDREWYSVPPAAARTISEGRARGGSIWAVGTTTVRALESAARADRTVVAAEGWAELLILPGFSFRVVDRLITNFHLPRSTLLMLVAAFAGYDLTFAAYEAALERGYRFYSYGDAMVIV